MGPTRSHMPPGQLSVGTFLRKKALLEIAKSFINKDMCFVDLKAQFSWFLQELGAETGNMNLFLCAVCIFVTSKYLLLCVIFFFSFQRKKPRNRDFCFYLLIKVIRVAFSREGIF